MPALKVPRSVLNRIGEVASGSILDNIKKQQQADGAALKVNKPATRRRKQRAGLGTKSLIAAMHRFVKGGGASWAWDVSNNKFVIIKPATSELAELSAHVQRMGYVGWFALNKEGVAATRQLFRDWIKADFRKAARRG